MITKTRQSLLEWEKDWIYENGQRYDNAFHQITVMDNIASRYNKPPYVLSHDTVGITGEYELAPLL